MAGITRIDQPEKKNHGYYVRVTHNNTQYQKYFPDKASGGKGKAKRRAQEHRDSILEKLPRRVQERYARPKRKVPQSGVKGVTQVMSRLSTGKTYRYWQALWKDEIQNRRTAKFSITRYGNDKAMAMAIKALGKAKRGVKKALNQMKEKLG